MSLLEKLFAAGRALRAGESLKNPAAWKNKQMLFSSLLVILTVVIQFMGLDVSDAQLNSISAGLADLGIIVNVYLTAATSEKVGLPIKVKTY